jgi:hypothetical protein
LIEREKIIKLEKEKILSKLKQKNKHEKNKLIAKLEFIKIKNLRKIIKNH